MWTEGTLIDATMLDTWPRLKVVYTVVYSTICFSFLFVSEWEHPHDGTITRVLRAVTFSLPDPLLLYPGHRVFLL